MTLIRFKIQKAISSLLYILVIFNLTYVYYYLYILIFKNTDSSLDSGLYLFTSVVMGCLLMYFFVYRNINASFTKYAIWLATILILLLCIETIEFFVEVYLNH